MGRRSKFFADDDNPYIHTHPEHIGLGYSYDKKAENIEDNEKNMNQAWEYFHNRLIEQGKQAYLLSFFENKLAKTTDYENNLKKMAELMKTGKGLKEIGKILDSVDEMASAALKSNTTYMNGLEAVKNTYSEATTAANIYSKFMQSQDGVELKDVLVAIGNLYEVNKTLFDKLGNRENLIDACNDYINGGNGNASTTLIDDNDFKQLRSLLNNIKNKEEYMKDKSLDTIDKTLKKSFHQLITYLQISEQSIVSKLTEEEVNEALGGTYERVKGQSSLNFNSYLMTKKNIKKRKAQPKTDKDIPISTEYFTLKTETSETTLNFDFTYVDLSMKFYTEFFDDKNPSHNLKLGSVGLGGSGYNLWEAFMIAKNDAKVTPEKYYYLVNSLAHTMKSGDTTRLSYLKDTLIKRFFLDTLVSRSKQRNEFNDYLVVNGRAYPVIGIFKDIFMTTTKKQKLTLSGSIGGKASLTSIASNVKINEIDPEQRSQNIHFNNLKRALELDKENKNITLGGELSGLQNFTKNVVSWGNW